MSWCANFEFRVARSYVDWNDSGNKLVAYQNVELVELVPVPEPEPAAGNSAPEPEAEAKGWVWPSRR